MIDVNPVFSDFDAIEGAAFHSYGTAEDLPIEVPTFHPSGDPTEIYRLAAGFYSTGESGVLTLSTKHLEQFFKLKSSGYNLALAALYNILILEPMEIIVHPTKKKELLLQSIRHRREEIRRRTGQLSESYPLIREDRER